MIVRDNELDKLLTKDHFQLERSCNLGVTTLTMTRQGVRYWIGSNIWHTELQPG
jgi:hypothetical protein